MKRLTALIIVLATSGTALAAQDPASPVLNEERNQALVQSAFDGDLARVQALLKKGASVDATAPKNRTALIWAATNGHTAVVEALHKAGADVNAQDSDNQTALMYATKKAHTDTVEFLLENGADVGLKSTKQGFTALILAATVGDVELVKLLLDHGADKSATDRSGNTAVDRARQFGNDEVVPLLEDLAAPAGNS